MAHARNNQLTSSPEWWKHLRKYNKRRFWKAERRAERELVEKEVSSAKKKETEAAYEEVSKTHRRSLDKLGKCP